MKGFIIIGFTLAMVIAGCAKDRAGCSGCSSTAASTFSPNSAYGSNSSSSVAALSLSVSPDSNIVQHKLCPVTGEPLDSMGGAIPVEANESTIFVCCQGCVKSVKNDPEKYLAIARAE